MWKVQKLYKNKYAIYAYTHGPVTGQILLIVIDSMQLTSDRCHTNVVDISAAMTT